MNVETPPRLLHFRVSHYNEKARWALDYKRWPHVREAMLGGFHIPRARYLTGQNRLPILILDGRALHDSTAIIAELERLRPEPPLYPADPTERERALALEDYFDEQVAPDMRRLFWSTYVDSTHKCSEMSVAGIDGVSAKLWRGLFPIMRPLFRRNMGLDQPSVARARERLPGFFDRLEAEIQPSGYLVGDSFTIADLTAAAVMTAIIRPAEFSYALPEPWPEALVSLRQSIAHRAGFAWVLDIYRRHRGPSYEVAA